MKTRRTFRLTLFSGLLVFRLSDIAIQAQTNQQHLSEGTRFILRGIDASLVKELQNAWVLSGAGFSRFEALILLFRMRDDSISAKSKGLSKELSQFNFIWVPNIIAVVHTHPNANGAKPSANDCALADRFKVPIFTITQRGMYVYDPFTRKTVEVQQGLEWLDLSKWRYAEASLAKSR